MQTSVHSAQKMSFLRLCRLCLIARRWRQAPAIDPVLRRLGLANHRVPVMTNHAPGGKPESVPIARFRRTT
jgi:hypothetical protein